MIAADHIRIENEFAWMVPPDFASSLVYEQINRPCDTCDGSGEYDPIPSTSQILGDEEYDVVGPCPDCDGTGRHTFDIEVDGAPDSGFIEPYRVHVIEVLPIGDDDTQGEGFLYRTPDCGPHWFIVGGGVGQPPTTLPPAAAPGMYAVRLAVH